MRALVTGCTGFAGSHLCEYLLEHGDEITGLVRTPEAVGKISHIMAKIRLVPCDIRDFDRVRGVIEQVRPQRIYHLAGVSSPSESLRNPRMTYEINFQGSFNLLEAWRQSGVDCRFLLVSSSQVYGEISPRDLPAREETRLNPQNPYAGSKAAAELLALQYFHSYRLPIVRVRPFNHTGSRQEVSFVCSSLARQVAEIELGWREPVITVGDLKVARDFSDVRDIVRGYHLALEHGRPGAVYQLCSGCPVSVETIVNHLTSLTSMPIKILIDQAKLRAHEANAIWGDASKASQELEWNSRHDLQSTLRDLEQYWRQSLRAGRAELSMNAAHDV